MYEQSAQATNNLYRTDEDLFRLSMADTVHGADIHYLAACISYGAKDYVNAELSIISALRQMPDDAEMLALYVEILWAQEKHEQAREALEKGLTASRHHYQLLALSSKMQTAHQ